MYITTVAVCMQTGVPLLFPHETQSRFQLLQLQICKSRCNAMQHKADETFLPRSNHKNFLLESSLHPSTCHCLAKHLKTPDVVLTQKCTDIPCTLNMIIREPSVDTSKYFLQGEAARWLAENET